MANIELPKDAEGREIPLNVESLYGANGEAVKPYSFTFRRTDGFCWEMRLVGSPNLVYDPKSFSSFGAMWALEWIPNHMRDMQEAACETFESY